MARRWHVVLRGIAATAVIAPLARTATAQRPNPDPLRAYQNILTGLAEIKHTNSDGLGRLETARAAAHRAEKPTAVAARNWRETARLRAKLHRDALAMVERHDRRVGAAAAELSREGRQRWARTGLKLVAGWIELGAPETVRKTIVARPLSLRTALLWQTDPQARRKFLAGVADRLSGTPARTDLEDLTELLAWTALFHSELPRGRQQLQAVTKDLVLVLTERDETGIRRSRSGYYRPGRFLDIGFGAELRDGSDQVRHFIWALRAMVRSPDLQATERLLDLKELRDSVTRGAPMEKADLALNRRAREVAATMLGVVTGVPRRDRVPRSVLDLAEVVRQALGR